MMPPPARNKTADTKRDYVLIADFGSQLTQLIARRVREAGVYCEIAPCHKAAAAARDKPPAAIILSGSPASLARRKAPRLDMDLLARNVPVLGICYGQQALCVALGGKAAPARTREYGRAELTLLAKSPLFAGISGKSKTLPVWMSHADKVEALPAGFAAIASSKGAPFAAIADERRRLYGVQFHPEVTHTPLGKQLIKNFVRAIAGCQRSWTMTNLHTQSVAEISKQAGKKARVICALSGGVDSAVTARLVHEAIGERLHCIFVDTGMMREGESEEVASLFRGHFNIPLSVVEAGDRFFAALKGVRDPEAKRKIIGGLFIDIFEEEAKKLGRVDFLAQGTLYPDIIESAPPSGAPSATIKSHHNVGGLPERMNLRLIEPLRMLFKDEVRALGRLAGLPEKFIGRHPFPGPGLAIRIPGAVNERKCALLRRADAVWLDEIRRAGLYDEIWQAFAVLLPVRSVGVMGDKRVYSYVCALRAVTSSDGMTAESFAFPAGVLESAATRIINEVAGINRVVYDVTSKPPGSIEWE